MGCCFRHLSARAIAGGTEAWCPLWTAGTGTKPATLLSSDAVLAPMIWGGTRRPSISSCAPITASLQPQDGRTHGQSSTKTDLVHPIWPPDGRENRHMISVSDRQKNRCQRSIVDALRNGMCFRRFSPHANCQMPRTNRHKKNAGSPSGGSRTAGVRIQYLQPNKGVQAPLSPNLGQRRSKIWSKSLSSEANRGQNCTLSEENALVTGRCRSLVVQDDA